MTFLFPAGADWTPDLLDQAWTEIEKIAKDELRISYYRPEVQIVSAKQMLDAYTSVGLPMHYKHWSFGKEFVTSEKAYKAGKMGLAYELVINSDPCIAYLMEENDALIQTLVMAHASVGHSAVFKNNYLFTEFTDAASIVDYLSFAKNYVKMCEERYGEDEVEHVLDACHALQTYGVDRYKKPKKLSPAKEEVRALERFEQELSDYDQVWEKIGAPMVYRTKKVILKKADSSRLDEPQENILYFLEKNAPQLPPWKREIIRIVRKLACYFQPQRQTKVVNEGYATFCHYYIIERMHEKGLIDAGSMLEFYAVHNNVVFQAPFSSLNPYKLGFSIFMDIKRICESPTDEDRRYFPNLCGKDWVDEVNKAMMNFRDETFITQYLSPKVARDLQLFSLNDPHILADNYTVTDICNESGFYVLRDKLASQYAIDTGTPDIQITNVDLKGTRELILTHFMKNGQPIHKEDAQMVINYIATLWEYDVSLHTWEYLEEEPSKLVLTAHGKYSPSKTK